MKLLSIAFILAAQAAFASIVTVPPSVTAGSAYRLVFVTSGTRNATSSNIADYNTFVSDAANAVPELQALGATWTAIASTLSGVSASTNIGASSSPIFLLDGSLVADSTTDLWDGSIYVPISLTELGTTLSNHSVFTGTEANGAGSFALGHPIPIVGWTSSTDSSWIRFTTTGSSFSNNFYAISSELIAPGEPAPEPGTAVLALSALGASLFMRRLSNASRLRI